MIAAGALLAILVVAAAPAAYAQTNTELLRTIHDTASDIALGMDRMLRSVDALLDDLRDVLDDLSGIAPMVEQNAESLQNIEAAIMGQACGEGTSPVAGTCVADIIRCDAEVENGVCRASIGCGEGTILHVDTCIADISISYCGPGTVFRGGVCVAETPSTQEPATGPAGTTQETGPETPGATIIEPAMTDRYVADGDTIEVTADGADVTYTLAFSDAPDLTETGGRVAVQYLDALCGTAPITVQAEGTPTGLGTRAVIHCGGIDASQAMVVSGHSSFDAADCSVREFVDVSWTHDRCIAAEAGPAGTTVSPEPATPEPVATPDPPTAPTAPATPEPIRGALAFREFTFPVTVGDVLGWERANDGDPMTAETISCLFPHTPERVDAVIADNSAGAYNINASPTYDDGNRHDSLIALTSPRLLTLFEQKFSTGTGYVPLDRERSIVDVGSYDGDYAVSMSLADWDDIAWSDTSDPPVPTEAEKSQKILDIQLRILTDIVNNECTISGAPAGKTSPHTRLLSLAATDTNGVLLDIIPHDVTCVEAVTVTAINVTPSGSVISGFDTIHVYDNEDGNSQDATIGAALNGPRLEGLAFRSADFVIGAGDTGPDSIAQSERGSVSLGGAVLVDISYDATSDDACAWTERTG